MHWTTRAGVAFGSWLLALGNCLRALNLQEPRARRQEPLMGPSGIEPDSSGLQPDAMTTPAQAPATAHFLFLISHFSFVSIAELAARFWSPAFCFLLSAFRRLPTCRLALPAGVTPAKFHLDRVAAPLLCHRERVISHFSFYISHLYRMRRLPHASMTNEKCAIRNESVLLSGAQELNLAGNLIRVARATGTSRPALTFLCRQDACATVGPRGFEPRFPGSKPRVLPLDDGPGFTSVECRVTSIGCGIHTHHLSLDTRHSAFGTPYCRAGIRTPLSCFRDRRPAAGRPGKIYR